MEVGIYLREECGFVLYFKRARNLHNKRVDPEGRRFKVFYFKKSLYDRDKRAIYFHQGTLDSDEKATNKNIRF